MDAIVLREDWLRAYDFTTDRGAAALNDYARNNNPFDKLAKAQVSVEVSSVIRASPDSFRSAWIERRYDNGQLAATERWSAILTIIVKMPRDLDRLRKNPLGIYVNAINWSRSLASNAVSSRGCVTESPAELTLGSSDLCVRPWRLHGVQAPQISYDSEIPPLPTCRAGR